MYSFYQIVNLIGYCFFFFLAQNSKFKFEFTLKNIVSTPFFVHCYYSLLGPTFAAKLTSLGTRQASLVLYRRDMYPYGAIGPVSYFWRPALTPQTTQSTIWVGCHLSIFSQVFDEITKCFDQGPSQVMTEGSSDVVVRPLNNELVKLRLFGPASNVVLSETLQLSPLISQCTDSPAQGNVDPWWKSYYSSSLQQASYKQQADVWRDLQSSTPGQVPANSILGLTVRDPRLLLPPKRSKVTLLNSGELFYMCRLFKNLVYLFEWFVCL